jgi:hypothetical protein
MFFHDSFLSLFHDAEECRAAFARIPYIRCLTGNSRRRMSAVALRIGGSSFLAERSRKPDLIHDAKACRNA